MTGNQSVYRCIGLSIYCLTKSKLYTLIPSVKGLTFSR